MSDQSAIEWTDATWNPTTGCTKIAPECANCYIDRTPPFRMAGRKFVHGKIPLELHEDRLDKPLHWSKPKRIFVNSLSDLFHEDVPDEFIDRVFATMALCQRHTFQVLTKRAGRMLACAKRIGRSIEIIERHARDLGYTLKWEGKGLVPWPLPNVWLGTSVGVQKRKSEINLLRETPAAVRFLSIEPLLEDLGKLDLTGIQWVIVGGESGSSARPMLRDWARSIREQCQAAGVPFFFKQWGEWAPGDESDDQRLAMLRVGRNGWREGETVVYLGESRKSVFRLGKHDAGRMLDGRTWNDYPGAPAYVK